jgi:hypothetical protein
MKQDPATPQMRDLAARMVAHEAGIGSPADVHMPASFRVCNKLRQPLTALTGSAGFRSLLSRALVIAQRKAPVLGEIRLGPDGSLEDGVVQTQTNQDRPGKAAADKNEQAEDGGLLLVAELLGLMHIFIGEAITLRLVRDVWPNASVYSTESGRTNKHES